MSKSSRQRMAPSVIKPHDPVKAYSVSTVRIHHQSSGFKMGDYQQYLPSKQEPKPSQPNVDEKQKLDEKAYRGWEEAFREGPLQRLRYLDALLARTTDPDRIARIKSRSAELIREVGPVAVLSDPSLISMVRQLFGAAGYERLKDRAKTAQLQQPDVVANMASSVHQRGER